MGGFSATADLVGGVGFIMAPLLTPAVSRSMTDLSGSAESSFDLLLRAKKGDQKAVEALFTRYLPRVRRWAHGRLPASSRSLLNTDDLAQEVLLRAVVSLNRFEPRHEGAFQGFLRQTILNRVRDEIRSSRRRPVGEVLEVELPGRDASPLEMAIGQEALERYEAALERLRPQDRELVVARCELDFSAAEIAEIFGKPTAAAAQVAVGRALVRLAEEMARG